MTSSYILDVFITDHSLRDVNKPTMRLHLIFWYGTLQVTTGNQSPNDIISLMSAAYSATKNAAQPRI